MKTDKNCTTSSAGEVEKYSKQSKSPAKEHNLNLASDFTGWEDNSQFNLTVLNANYLIDSTSNTKRKSEVKELMPLKNISRLKKKIQCSLPDFISAYEISKVHPRYRKFFDLPLKSFKEKERFPEINNKSLLSVYLPCSLDRKMMKKVFEGSTRNGIYERNGKKDKRNRVNSLEPVGRLITIYNVLK